jgi:hypothetical protein
MGRIRVQRRHIWGLCPVVAPPVEARAQNHDIKTSGICADSGVSVPFRRRKRRSWVDQLRACSRGAGRTTVGERRRRSTAAPPGLPQIRLRIWERCPPGTLSEGTSRSKSGGVGPLRCAPGCSPALHRTHTCPGGWRQGCGASLAKTLAERRGIWSGWGRWFAAPRPRACILSRPPARRWRLW